ncbi:hypothetical protein Ae201684P_015464 [Aphanomyces euteiches]|nr:hypothetical protein Ae201684P_015464 [Aphanomyces euteiches]KAH9154276.1 hypothetical protein AeRB84_003604 [Aphanomyces euteiches]
MTLTTSSEFNFWCRGQYAMQLSLFSPLFFPAALSTKAINGQLVDLVNYKIPPFNADKSSDLGRNTVVSLARVLKMAQRAPAPALSLNAPEGKEASQNEASGQNVGFPPRRFLKKAQNDSPASAIEGLQSAKSRQSTQADVLSQSAGRQAPPWSIFQPLLKSKSHSKFFLKHNFLLAILVLFIPTMLV